jgi:hypothetical protein
VNDVTVTKGQVTDLGQLIRNTQGREQIFQVVDMDLGSFGFQYGGAPRQHAFVTKCSETLSILQDAATLSSGASLSPRLGHGQLNFTSGRCLLIHLLFCQSPLPATQVALAR